MSGGAVWWCHVGHVMGGMKGAEPGQVGGQPGSAAGQVRRGLARMLCRAGHAITKQQARVRITLPIAVMPPRPCILFFAADNKDLHIRAPLTGLAALPHLVLLDFRHVHVVEKTAYWPEAKCVTMQHLTKLVNVLKRRQPQPRVLLEM